MYRILSFSFAITIFCITLVANAASENFPIHQLIGSDTTPPSVPTNLTATPVAISQIDLSWSSSTDNFMLSGYQVFRDDVQIATTTVTTYSDTGLAASTTYSYYVTAFDSSGNISASSSVVSTTTLASSIPPATTTPTTTTSGGGGGTSIELQPPEFALTYLEVIPDRNSAIIRFGTRGYVRSVVRWGRTISYELGSLEEEKFSRTHEISITGLSPGTTYHFTIEGTNSVGVYGTLTSDTFTTLTPVDVSPPANVENLEAQKSGGDILLDWQNPSDPDFDKVRVLRSDRFFPSDPADGWVVYEGSGQNVRDTGAAVPDTIEYYTVFSYDKNGNISSGAVVALNIGETTTTPVTPIEEGKNEINFSFDDLIFIQDGQVLPHKDMLVNVDGSKPLTVLIPYGSLPEDLKTILVTLTDSKDSNKIFSFILRINADKSAYEARLAPFRTAGVFPLRVAMFDFKTEQVGYAHGGIVSKIIFEHEEQNESFLAYLFRQLTNTFGGYLLLFIIVLALMLLLARKLLARKHETRHSH